MRTTIAVCLAVAWLSAQAPEPARDVRFPAISETDLTTWLTYLSSDELGGREVFSEGYGIAAQFIAERLREFGVTPLGDGGSYFQIVKLQSYNVVRRSSVTIEVNGQTRTFQDGDHVAFPASAGGRQTLLFDGAEFAGAGGSADFGGRDVTQKLLLLGPSPAGGRAGRGAALLEATAAGASIEHLPVVSPPPSGRGRGRGGQGGPQADIPATTRRVDALVAPRLTADDEFFAALLAGRPGGFEDLKARVGRGEAAPAFSLAGVKVTIQVDNSYEPVVTRLTRNVVGMVEGSDPQLRDTYVMLGAHLDHVGYAETSQDAPGRVVNPIATDRIWNGADDDGTGSTAQMAIAKAFATGPRPKRSVVFVWHTGEEASLYGSRFNADFPVVPLDRVQCQLNIDMIGRNRDNEPSQRNTVFVIGADRISTDLHNVIVDTNASLASPMTLDYEYNDPQDSNSFYTRSDHYSYASKGLPTAFFFTGEHPDYHANSDSVEKILFDKQARVTQLIYQIGFAVADSDRELRRDHRGARSGRGFAGRLQ